jgi:hypothetical protein
MARIPADGIRTVVEMIERDELNGEPIAKPSAKPPLRSKSPELPIGTGRVRSGLSKPVRPHRKPRLKGSGGRRAQR